MLKQLTLQIITGLSLATSSFAGTAKLSKNDIRQFCVDTGKAGWSSDFSFQDNQWSASEYPALETKLQGYTSKIHVSVITPGRTEGDTTYLPVLSYGTGVYQWMMMEAQGQPSSDQMTDETLENDIRSYLKTPDTTDNRRQPLNPDGFGNQDDAINDKDTASNRADLLDQVSSKLDLLCLKYTVLHAEGCSKSLKLILKTMVPDESTTMSQGVMARGVVDQVVSDPSYVQGAGKAALIIMDRVKNKSLDGDLLTDITQAFLSSGLSQADAEDHAWNLIAVWATRGPNIKILNLLYADKSEIMPFYGTLLALDMISSAAPYLDQLRIESGKSPYSYQGVQTTCSYGKPYHYWMSAWLTRKFGIETGSPIGAMYAAYISELGYQMRSTTAGRDPNRAFMTDTFGSANNKIRIDLAFASAGAVYGMEVASKKAISSKNIDQAILKLMKNAVKRPVMDLKDAQKEWAGLGLKGFLRWDEIFSPTSALNFFRKAD